MILTGRKNAIIKNNKSLFQLASSSAERAKQSVPSAATSPQQALAGKSLAVKKLYCAKEFEEITSLMLTTVAGCAIRQTSSISGQLPPMGSTA
jgi:hypothetical protein